jgi:hypothetical protein
MKSLAVVALALSLAPPVARAQQANTASGSYGRGPSHKGRSSADARIGGTPTNPPEASSSAEGRARAGYDVGMASATAGGRTDTGPVGEAETQRRSADRDHSPSLAQPTREEILEAQRRGRIRDRGKPDWTRGPELTELEIPNPLQVQEAIKNPYRHRQDDLKP